MVRNYLLKNNLKESRPIYGFRYEIHPMAVDYKLAVIPKDFTAVDKVRIFLIVERKIFPS